MSTLIPPPNTKLYLSLKLVTVALALWNPKSCAQRGSETERGRPGHRVEWMSSQTSYGSSLACCRQHTAPPWRVPRRLRSMLLEAHTCYTLTANTSMHSVRLSYLTHTNSTTKTINWRKSLYYYIVERDGSIYPRNILS